VPYIVSSRHCVDVCILEFYMLVPHCCVCIAKTAVCIIVIITCRGKASARLIASTDAEAMRAIGPLQANLSKFLAYCVLVSTPPPMLSGM